MSGHNRVWAQSCLGTIVSGHNRVGSIVWAQSCMGLIVVEPLFGFTSYLSNIWKKNDHLVISQVGRYSTVVNIRFYSRGLNGNFLNKLKYKKSNKLSTEKL